MSDGIVSAFGLPLPGPLRLVAGSVDLGLAVYATCPGRISASLPSLQAENPPADRAGVAP